MTSRSDRARLNANLPGEVMAMIDQLAAAQASDRTAVVTRAVIAAWEDAFPDAAASRRDQARASAILRGA